MNLQAAAPVVTPTGVQTFGHAVQAVGTAVIIVGGYVLWRDLTGHPGASSKLLGWLRRTWRRLRGRRDQTVELGTVEARASVEASGTLTSN